MREEVVFKESSVRRLLFVLSVPGIVLLGIWWYMGASQSSAMTSPVVVAATAKHTATVIFLHGLGDTGHGWSQILQSIRAAHIKYICPTAPIQPVSLNNGFRMPSWFDIKGLTPNSPEDEEGIHRARDTLQSLVEQEIENGIPSHRIIIGGFSQGGAVALYTALTYQKPFAGVLALSSWIPLHKTFEKVISESNRNIHVLQCHGTSDPMVPFKWGETSSDLLKKISPNVEFKSYPGMMHSSCEEEMSDVKAFIEKQLPPS